MAAGIDADCIADAARTLVRRAQERTSADRAAAQLRVKTASIDTIVATGEFIPAFETFAAQLGDRLITAADAPAAWAPLSQRLKGNEVVLLKGSRGVALERLLPNIEQQGTRSQSGAAAARNPGA